VLCPIKKFVLRFAIKENKMFRGRLRFRAAMQNFMAWFGLLLMAASLVWWEWNPRPAQTALPRRSAAQEPFSLVVLDPGHGGQDSGAMCGNVLEKDLALDVARRVDRLLQAQGLATLMTRVGDGYVSLADRVALANRARDCVFVSIHFNEGNKPVSSGVETYYAAHQSTTGTSLVSWLPFLQQASSESPNTESQNLAGLVQDSLIVRTQSVNRGIKAEQFFVIANVRYPAVLVEGGFLTNKEDIARIGSEDYREQLAAAISEGVLNYRDGVKKRQPTLAVTAPDGSE
jgi:N-acetylmuramoyl-L-alanine amidase